MKSKITKLALLAIIILAGLIFILKETKLKNPNGWPEGIERYSRGAGWIRVVDVKANQTLFLYYDDQNLNPISFEQTIDGRWIVQFKKR